MPRLKKKSPLTPLTKGENLPDFLKKSPFSKGGFRGILIFYPFSPIGVLLEHLKGWRNIFY